MPFCDLQTPAANSLVWNFWPAILVAKIFEQFRVNSQFSRQFSMRFSVPVSVRFSVRVSVRFSMQFSKQFTIRFSTGTFEFGEHNQFFGCLFRGFEQLAIGWTLWVGGSGGTQASVPSNLAVPKVPNKPYFLPAERFELRSSNRSKFKRANCSTVITWTWRTWRKENRLRLAVLVTWTDRAT